MVGERPWTSDDPQETSAIRTETLRYFACAASYECAPFAAGMAIAMAADWVIIVT